MKVLKEGGEREKQINYICTQVMSETNPKKKERAKGKFKKIRKRLGKSFHGFLCLHVEAENSLFD